MAPKARPSIRRRLLILLVSGTAVIWFGIALATFTDARYHAGRVFDAQLEEYAEVLSAIVGHEVFEVAGDITQIEHEFGQSCTYQVFALTGELLLRSHAAPMEALATADGFSETAVEGRRWRTFRYTDVKNHFAIVVAHTFEQRDALVHDFALRLLLPLAIGLPLIAVALWLAVARSLGPLDRLASEVRGREPERLGPVHGARAPVEVAPLVDALNHLFLRLERSFSNERRFTGDAAHELRNPLAALRTQAEVALTTADDQRRQHALEQVVVGAERATRLVEQLLTLARLDATQAKFKAHVDLGRVCREAAEAMRDVAEARRIDVAVSSIGAGYIRGDAEMLYTLVRNLLENALRHTPEGGEVRLAVAPVGGRVLLTVEDSGPGVPPGLRERIFDRLFRDPDAQSGASGLGLSIARRVAELHGGTIEAFQGARLGGLEVRASFPELSQGRIEAAAKAGDGLSIR